MPLNGTLVPTIVINSADFTVHHDVIIFTIIFYMHVTIWDISILKLLFMIIFSGSGAGFETGQLRASSETWIGNGFGTA